MPSKPSKHHIAKEKTAAVMKQFNKDTVVALQKMQNNYPKLLRYASTHTQTRGHQ
jgi:hypothetical protein